MLQWRECYRQIPIHYLNKNQEKIEEIHNENVDINTNIEPLTSQKKRSISKNNKINKEISLINKEYEQYYNLENR